MASVKSCKWQQNGNLHLSIDLLPPPPPHRDLTPFFRMTTKGNFPNIPSRRSKEIWIYFQMLHLTMIFNNTTAWILFNKTKHPPQCLDFLPSIDIESQVMVTSVMYLLIVLFTCLSNFAVLPVICNNNRLQTIPNLLLTGTFTGLLRQPGFAIF